MKIQRKIGPDNTGELAAEAGALRSQAATTAQTAQAVAQGVGALVQFQQAYQRATDRLETVKARTVFTAALDTMRRDLERVQTIDGEPVDRVGPKVFRERARGAVADAISGARLSGQAKREFEAWASAYAAQQTGAVEDWALRQGVTRLRDEGMATVAALQERGLYGEAQAVATQLNEDGLLTADDYQTVGAQLRRDQRVRVVQDTMRLKHQAGQGIEFLMEIDADPELRANPGLQREVYDVALRQLEVLNRAQAKAAAAAEDERRATEDALNREGTLLLVRGELTNGWIDSALRRGLKPEVARTLRGELRTGDTPSDPRTLFAVSTNVLSYDADEIATMPGLSWEDRGKLILKREQRANSWASSQAAREGSDRIDRALRIPPGMNAAMLSEDVLNRRGRALAAWYDRVDALPPAEREAQALPMAKLVIADIVLEQDQNDLAAVEARLSRLMADNPEPADMSPREQKQYEQTRQRLEAQRDALRTRIRQGTGE